MKLLFVSLGCDKNLVDSEEMLGLLTRNGHEIIDDETKADAIIVNTCCFIGDAKEESVNTILEMAEYKKAGSFKALIVTGCMAQRYKEEIIQEIPEVDAVLGTTSYGEILKAMEAAEAVKHFQEFKDIDYLPEDLGRRVLTTGGHYGYLKIAEGCDKHCTYCIIPKLRGRYRSVPMERLLKQAMDMAEQGVKELILVAQETTVYGKDLYGKKSLHILLKEICKIQGIRWIRILYCYPEEIYDELIQVMKHSKKICRHLHLPLQSGSTEILRRMNRRYTKEQYLALAEKLRREIPDLSLTTDIIVGFPGETEEDFQETLDVVRRVRYDSAFTFIYSKRTGTPAAAMENQIPEDVVKDRFNRLLTLVQDISREQSLRVQGQTLPVLVESVNEQDSSLVTGRLSNNLLVHFPGDASMIGEIVPVYLKECMGFYYYGERVEA